MKCLMGGRGVLYMYCRELRKCSVFQETLQFLHGNQGLLHLHRTDAYCVLVHRIFAIFLKF